MSSSPPRILVIRGGAIGDFVLTLPAIRLIREALPACQIEVLGYPGIMELAVKAGLAHSTRSLEHRSMALLFAKGAALDPALVEYLKSFNMVISYLFDPDGVMRGQMEAAGVKTFIECPHQVRPGQGHAAEQLARPLEKLAMFLEEPEWRRPLFETAGNPPVGNRIALHLGSGSLKKTWPAEMWKEVTARLKEQRPDLEWVLVSGEAEQDRGLSTEGFGHTAHWHSLPLPELADQLTRCRFFLGHDSGISHLAAACGVPSLLLFGPTDPGTWAPPQAGVHVLRAEDGNWEKLTPDTVTTTVIELLK